MANQFIHLTRPDKGKVYVRRSSIDFVLQPNQGGFTEILIAGTHLMVRETDVEILRDID